MAKVSIRILIMLIWETHKKMPSDLHDRLVNAIGDDSSHYINYDGYSGVTNATYENVQDEFFTSYLDDEFSVEGLTEFYGKIIKEMSSSDMHFDDINLLQHTLYHSLILCILVMKKHHRKQALKI